MAEPSTKDRDLNVPTAETTSASGPSLPNSAKARNKLNLNSINGPKKQPKKAAEKVRIDNLPESELQALLDEVLQYSGKRDGEKGSELFQALLRETQESGEESPPAFRPTQNTSNPSAIQQRRRRSRKETSVPFSSAGASSVSSNTVAGSNRKGGSLQNISSHSQSEWGSVRRRKRHDTSDSGSALGSPRKREGGSLPCDVARGSNKTVKPDELVLNSGHIPIERSHLTNDCVINMEGMIESSASFSESEDKFPDRWNHHIRRTEHSSNTSGIEPMEQDMEHSSSEHAGLTKKLVSKGSKEYGTIQSFEVDATIPFIPLDSTATNQEVTRSTTTMNGSSVDDGIPFQRRIHRPTGVVGDVRMDENGNPFGTVNGTPMSFLQRTSPPAINTTNIPTTNSGLVSSGLSTTKTVQRNKNKKKGENVLLSNELPGFVGNRNVDELLEYIESSESNGKKAADKKTGLKHNGTLTKDSSSKVKPKDKKSSSKLLHRQTNSNQADSEDSDAAGGCDSINSPVGKDDDSIFRAKTDGVEELEAAVAAAATDFQTVTKRQRRKKRNSLSNSTTGSKTKELLEQSHMNLFYNASSPSVMMRPPRQPPATSSGSQTAIHGGGNGLVGGNEAVKKLVASVPPSEPSDLDSDGGDSVHSLPVQPSAPLFPPLPMYQPPPSSSAQNSISYADIMRSDQHHAKSDVVFLAESSQPVDVKQHCATNPVTALVNPINAAGINSAGPAPLTDLVAPAATSTAAANVPCNRTAPRSTLSGVPLRRAASLPPTSPSVETPPVVIVGSSSSTQVDVTFGFELNEQLLALSIQPSLTSQPPKAIQSSPLTPPEASTEAMMVSFSPEPRMETKTELGPLTTTPPSSSPEAVTTPTAVDFASRYRERPDLLNPPLSRRSYEIVDFISQAWKRIERKLDEQQQQQQQQQQHGIGNNASLSLQSTIRVYTLE